ncbi:alpha/beta hydrolase [Parapedobacter tibetensis]|uniref:alpha/beta hydrolase n=1 Tax=Parapedobacter tibetensis TaxID=2972951 RepID=UPI00214D467C|nr:alpha/beta fold hydrolase [Parapedobacter tibetensis]
MSKLSTKKIVRRSLKFIIINCILYVLACFVLIYWPVPSKKDIENYDYSSIRTSSKYHSTGENEWIQTRSKEKLFCRVFPSESKTVLILIHGSGSEGRYLSNLAQSLAENNTATVITPDLRGHGESAFKKGDISYIGQLENDIEDIIDYTKNQLSAKKIILAGHSSGGGLVLRYLGNQKLTKIDKAIMISPYLGHTSPTVKSNSGGWVTVAVKRWIGLSMLNHLGVTYFN